MQHTLLTFDTIASLRKENTMNWAPLFLVASLTVVPLARADNFYVNKTADTADGSCDVTDCSLREAVIASNGTPVADTIYLPTGVYTLSIPGTNEQVAATGDLDITSEVTILGDAYLPSIVDGGGIDRVFDVMAGVIVKMEWLTIRNGYSDGGGGLRVVSSQANVTLDRCLVTENTSTGYGGGLKNLGGVLYVENSTVSGNTAAQGGGVASFGNGTTALVFSTVSYNIATGISNGLALVNSGSTFVLRGTIINIGRSSGTACFGSGFLSTGHNIEGPGDTCDLTAEGDQVNVSGAQLALHALDWYGGPTRTHALGPTSVAVDGGGVGGGEGTCPDVDQRGGPRTDGTCDVGSYELNAVPPELIFRDGFESGNTTAWSNSVP
jgi:CSLREA domain-containing protein